MFAAGAQSLQASPRLSICLQYKDLKGDLKNRCFNYLEPFRLGRLREDPLKVGASGSTG